MDFYGHPSSNYFIMKKTILTYGIIAGLISSSLFIGLMLLGRGADHDFENGMIYGYTLMILAFVFIFVATKITRDKHMGGNITFGKAFLIGLYISFIASTVYVLVWFIDLYAFNPDFVAKYAAHTIETMKAAGASASEIAASKAQMDKLAEMYKNPLFVALLTYAEILPVGLLVSVISALVLRKKNKDGSMAVPVAAH